jgi:hypothetical protein
MRKISVALLVMILGASCFATVIAQVLAQTSIGPAASPVLPPPLIVRSMRYRGAITTWGSEPYKGTITVNAKTANVPPPLFKPWVTVDAFWSNEPPFPSAKPVGGQYSFTHYEARLIKLAEIRKQTDSIVNVTGIWNVNKVKITTTFDQNGAPISTIREVTQIASQKKGQLLIPVGWKSFVIKINGIEALSGVEISMFTVTGVMSPFSYQGGPSPNLADLRQIVGCFRAVPGFANYNPELDYNKDSKIDIADLTTVAANM